MAGSGNAPGATGPDARRHRRGDRAMPRRALYQLLLSTREPGFQWTAIAQQSFGVPRLRVDGFERRIIHVSLLLAGVERGGIGLVEWRVPTETFRKVRVREERHAVRDEVGLARGDDVLARRAVVAAVRDERAAEHPTQDRRDPRNAVH